MKRIGMFVLLALFVLLASGCEKQKNIEKKTEKKSKFAGVSMEEASTTPYGKYPELITYTLGKMTAENNPNMPEGDTYEDNVYTRYLRDMLNIQNDDVFEASGSLYDNMVSMAITDRELPDIMVVQDLNTLKKMTELDLIEDLSEAYDNCASGKIKEIYESYGGSALDIVTIDGRLMAIPGTNILNGPNLLWLRRDWMDKLSLKAPENLMEAEEIIRQFVRKDPGGNGPGQTVGLVFDIKNLGDPDKNYSLDVIFSYFGAFPKKWMVEEDGDISYGSVTPEAKKAIAHIAELYREKILDQQFLVRTNSNIDELIMSGRCGSFFGPWWAPNNPLMNAYQRDNTADWYPYLIPTGADGGITTYTQDASNKYIVVRKGYEHPEIAIKIINVLFDYTRYVDLSNKEIQSYYSLNIDPTVRPLAVNVDYRDALFRTTENVKKALAGELMEDELITIEKSYYDTCKSYLEHEESPSAQEWAAYMSRIITVDILSEADIHYAQALEDKETSTMKKEGWNLELMEKNAYLKLISGEAKLSYFDDFVEEWRSQGGQEIEKELREMSKARK